MKGNLIKTNESDLRKAEKEVEGFLFIFFGFEEFESWEEEQLLCQREVQNWLERTSLLPDVFFTEFFEFLM